MRRLALLILCAPLVRLGAQNVRGVVTELSTGTPLRGVLVSLAPADSVDGTPVATGLSSDRGTYFLHPPRPGRYRVVAKRIGVRRFVSDPLDLDGNVEVELAIALEPFAFQLAPVRVEGSAMCVNRSGQAGRLASLWDEARTALAATQISLRDRLFQARIERYLQVLEPRSLRVEEERWRTSATGVVERPFVSLSGDSLSRAGYWRRLPNDSVAYDAPDAAVLLSRAFTRDHCFTLTEGRRERAGLTGIAFAPVSGRTTPDVEGTIWLDAKTFELRLVEFQYTELPRATITRGIGGEVRFARLASGAWFVDRWFIRMPRYSARPLMRSSGIPGQPPTEIQQVINLIEVGGTVTPEPNREPPG